MFSKLQDRLGTAGLAVAIVALIAALGGTAFAAQQALNGKQKKEVEKIAKKFAGKNGKAGNDGAAGPAGPAGAAGKDGTNGGNGADGTDGTDGVSPTGTAFAGNANGCTEGGVKFEGANTTIACNGVNGKNVEVGTEATGTANCGGRGGATVQVAGEPATKKFACTGEEGSPWVAGMAPPNAVLKGIWSIPQYTAAGAEEIIPVPLSTGVPIKPGGAFGTGLFVVVLQKGVNLPGQTTEEREEAEVICPGEADQPAPPVGFVGTACVYIKEATNLAAPGFFDNSLVESGGGVALGFKSVAAGGVKAFGSWALKAS